jgi:hypothetical protein
MSRLPRRERYPANIAPLLPRHRVTSSRADCWGAKPLSPVPKVVSSLTRHTFDIQHSPAALSRFSHAIIADPDPPKRLRTRSSCATMSTVSCRHTRRHSARRYDSRRSACAETCISRDARRGVLRPDDLAPNLEPHRFNRVLELALAGRCVSDVQRRSRLYRTPIAVKRPLQARLPHKLQAWALWFPSESMLCAGFANLPLCKHLRSHRAATRGSLC